MSALIQPSRRSVIVGAGALAGCAVLPDRKTTDGVLWTFDQLATVGGEAITVEGAPVVIDSPWGPAVRFDGVDDALFIERHPLAGAETWTIECLIRPDGGAFEQRFLHLAELATTPGDSEYSGARFLFEIRVEGQAWWLDAFTTGPGYNHTLIFPDRRHPVGQWFHVAQSYDGAVYRSYVDGALQGEAPLAFRPQGPGRASVGVRINRVSWFNGAIREARFAPRFLPPEAFSRPA